MKFSSAAKQFSTTRFHAIAISDFTPAVIG